MDKFVEKSLPRCEFPSAVYLQEGPYRPANKYAENDHTFTEHLKLIIETDLQIIFRAKILIQSIKR